MCGARRPGEDREVCRTVTRLAAVIAMAVPLAVPLTVPLALTADTYWGPRTVRAPIGYSPTWLPAGFREYAGSIDRDRSRRTDDRADSGTVVDRSWTPDAPDDTPKAVLGITVFLGYRAEWYCAGVDGRQRLGHHLDINGTLGWFDPSRARYGEYSLCWQPAAGTMVKISDFDTDLESEDLWRIARSVRPVEEDVTLPLRMRPDDIDETVEWEAGITGSGSD
jgi:hypothetical protein